MASLVCMALGYAAPPSSDGACSMTDTGNDNVWKVEMWSTVPSQPYKEIHCRFQGSDRLVSFGGRGSPATGQCDACVRSSGYSATCGCVCPPGGANCTWTFYGELQFDTHSNVSQTVKSCTCNGLPGPPIPPAPAPAPPRPPAPPGPCKAKLDVVVVLDGSGSITAADWQRALAFTGQVVDSFDVAADAVNLAAVQFSSFVRTIIGLSGDAAAIKSAVAKEHEMGDMTNTAHGFERAKSILDSEGRADAKGKVVILLTDGAQDEGLPAKGESVALQAEGVQVFGIGVGSQIDERELKSWVSPPAAEHYFSVGAFDELDKILKQIVAGACPPP